MGSKFRENMKKTEPFQGVWSFCQPQLIGDAKNVHVLASAKVDGEIRPLIWTRQAGKGRVLVSIPGHYTWTLNDPLFRTVLLRGIAWAAGEPVERMEGF